jgi:cysteinyl-tRNA synthetase
MSKSLGNFFTLRDLLAKGFTGREIRYSLLTAHYRETFNFTLEGLQGARTALARIDECLGKLREAAGAPNSNSAGTHLSSNQQPAGPETRAPTDLLVRFSDALDDDLNISAAWGSVFEWVRETNRRLAENSLSTAEATAALTAWNKIDSGLGVGTRK